MFSVLALCGNLKVFRRVLQKHRGIGAVMAVLLISSFAAYAKAPLPVPWTIRYEPARVVNGSPVLFRVTTPKLVRTLTAKWLDHNI